MLGKYSGHIKVTKDWSQSLFLVVVVVLTARDRSLNSNNRLYISLISLSEYEGSAVKGGSSEEEDRKRIVQHGAAQTLLRNVLPDLSF